MTDLSGRVLAFDIGIRNLAWCFVAGNQILGWQNYDLLTGQGAEASKGKLTCSRCSVAAAWQAGAAGAAPPTCQRHCPPSHPPLKDLSGGAVYKKLPGLPELRSLAAAAALAAGMTPPKKGATKVALLGFLATRHSLPLEKVKLKKAVEHELTTIHDSIRTFVAANAALFHTADVILLENQPVLKNPTMKSVQILLFATLRDLLQPGPPALKLVHAGKKVVGQETGDAGYKSRKDASEARVRAELGGATPKIAAAAEWLAHFQGHTKKSDLADAFCMAVDRLQRKA